MARCDDEAMRDPTGNDAPVASDLTYSTDGTALGITARTAKAHVAAILVKLAAQDRAEAVARGFECGLLRP